MNVLNFALKKAHFAIKKRGFLGLILEVKRQKQIVEMEMNFTKEHIYSQVMKGEFSISDERKKGMTGRATSEVWQIFSDILDEHKCIVKGFVGCKICKRVYCYNGRQTTGLLRHACNKTTGRSVKVDNTDRNNITDDLETFIVMDSRPFTTVDGEGFHLIARSLLDTGAKYGPGVDEKHLLAHSTTISRRVVAKNEDIKSKIRDMLREFAEDGRCAFTTDLWTDGFKRRSYICVTVHWIDGTEMNELLLGIQSMSSEKTSSKNIRRKINEIMDEYNIPMSNATFVTDMGSNIVKALDNVTRLNCSLHLVNDILIQSFEACAGLKPLLANCRKIVKCFEKSKDDNLNCSTGTCITRWNSNLPILKSVFNNRQKVNDVIQNKNNINQLSDVDIDVISKLILILEKIDIVIKELQACDSPTLHKVYCTIDFLKRFLNSQPFDDKNVTNFLINLLEKIDSLWLKNLHIIHKVANFLFPPTNKLTLFTASEKEEIKDYVLQEMIKLQKRVPVDVKPVTPVESNCIFSCVTEQTNVISVNIICREELEHYSNTPCSFDPNFDVIEWWSARQKEYPNLCKLANAILNIPASSAPSERVFSDAGNVISDKRSNLSAEKVDSLMINQSYYKLMAK